MATRKKNSARVELMRPTYHLSRLMTSYMAAAAAKLVAKSFGKRPQEIPKDVLAGPESDAEKLNGLIAKFSPRPHSNPQRAKYRAEEVRNVIGKISVDTYLDFGCGDASITLACGKLFGARIIYGVDVYNARRRGVKYAKNLEEIPSGSIELATCFVSLHHMNAQEEISRLFTAMKPRGLVVIREHDDISAADEYFYDYLQLVHISAAMWDEYGDLDEILRSANYHSREEWDRMFSSAGFVRVGFQGSMENNPQRLFYGIWQKP